MSLLLTVRNIRGINFENNVIGNVSIEILLTVLQHQCDEQHRPSQRIAAPRLTNRFMPSYNLIAPTFTDATSSHLFFHCNFVLEWFSNVSKHLTVIVCICMCLRVFSS